jgi:restriction system protein
MNKNTMNSISDTDDVSTALNLLGEKIKPILKPKDYEPHESHPKQIRWRNHAQWARNQMANIDGRMKKDSPRGVWEISPAGKVWLKKNS